MGCRRMKTCLPPSGQGRGSASCDACGSVSAEDGGTDCLLCTLRARLIGRMWEVFAVNPDCPTYERNSDSWDT